MSDPSLELLYSALATPIGIAITVSDFERARGKLYAARRASGDPALDALQLRRSPVHPEFEIWIVKGTSMPKTESPVP